MNHQRAAIRMISMLVLPFLPGAAGQAQDGFRPLFNGRDLTGWRVVVADHGVVEDQDLFTVQDGAIHVYPNADDGSEQPFGGIMTEETFRDYHLRLQFKWGTKKFAPRADAVRDAGLLFHVHGEPVIWPASVECQIQEGDCGDIWIIGQTRSSTPIHPASNGYHPQGDLVTLGAGLDKGVRVPRSASWEIEGWNTIEIIVRGADARFLVNGKVVNEALHMRWRHPGEDDWQWRPLTEGAIFLQAEGAEVYYRAIEIKPLD